MPRVEIEPTIPVFEKAKTVHALDRVSTVIGSLAISLAKSTWPAYIYAVSKNGYE
jgi:hypothetical protein